MLKSVLQQLKSTLNGVVDDDGPSELAEIENVFIPNLIDDAQEQLMSYTLDPLLDRGLIGAEMNDETGDLKMYLDTVDLRQNMMIGNGFNDLDEVYDRENKFIDIPLNNGNGPNFVQNYEQDYKKFSNFY